MQKRQESETVQQAGRKSESSAGLDQASMATKKPSIHEEVSLEQMLESDKNLGKLREKLRKNLGDIYQLATNQKIDRSGTIVAIPSGVDGPKSCYLGGNGQRVARKMIRG
ncbi:MAG: hypothetical protein ABW086_16605 [Sedimenticola sp.]